MVRPAQCDVCIDLHATNKPSVPFVRIAGEVTSEHERLVTLSLRTGLNLSLSPRTPSPPPTLKPVPHLPQMRWLGAPVLLGDPGFTLAGEVCTTDEYVGSHGGVGICFETGHADDTSLVSQAPRHWGSGIGGLGGG